METKTFKEEWLIWIETKELLKMVTKGIPNITDHHFQNRVGQLERKIAYHERILNTWGCGSIIEVRFQTWDDNRPYKYDGVYFINITPDDAKTLVKYKFKNVNPKTIYIKELQAGDIILNL